jgi:hypothetical protein
MWTYAAGITFITFVTAHFFFCVFLQEEVRRNKGKKVDDPFTRRSTKPRMVFKVHDQENMEDTQMIITASEVSRLNSVRTIPWHVTLLNLLRTVISILHSLLCVCVCIRMCTPERERGIDFVLFVSHYVSSHRNWEYTSFVLLLICVHISHS